MSDLLPHQMAEIPDGPPLLQVVVDTEEEFDWSKPFDRSNTSVQSMKAQDLAQNIFDKYGVKPTYVIDYPVATDSTAVSILKSYSESNRCSIGAHLHPWVTPPFDEILSTRNSYPGNLKPALERQKLQALSDVITAAFGKKPVIYKAGRYGLGQNTPAMLADMGYLIDLSIVPDTNFGSDGGPDFRGYSARPFWFGPALSLFEIPLTRGYWGRAASFGPSLFHAAESNTGRALRLGGIWSRLGLLERITLTPEGIDTPAQLRLIDALRARGQRIFTLSYHSPSLMPGNTPYVRDEAQLRQFLHSLETVVDTILGKFGGMPTSPLEVRALCRRPGASADNSSKPPS